jgi:hypothetical protein
MATLGILRLCNDNRYVGDRSGIDPGLAEPGRFDFPTISRRVPGAWAENVVGGDPGCEPAYVTAAEELVADGADAITSDCGFTLRYQRAIAAAVPVPVATSSLLLLPTVLAQVPRDRKVALLVADTRSLDAGMLRLLGIDDASRLVIDGFEGTDTYAGMWARKSEMSPARIVAETDAIVDRALAGGGVAAILCECTAFVRVSRRMRARTGLPVYDAALNVALLMAAVGERSRAARRQAEPAVSLAS